MSTLGRDLGAGAMAGAVATLALDACTYLDMLLRGRPASSVPADVAGRSAERLGVDLGPADSDSGRARREGLGALLGYATGVSAGTAYALARRRWSDVPVGAAGLAAGLAVMAATDTGSVAAGVTDPREWGASGWLADLVPHAVYGLALAAVFDRTRRR